VLDTFPKGIVNLAPIRGFSKYDWIAMALDKPIVPAKLLSAIILMALFC